MSKIKNIHQRNIKWTEAETDHSLKSPSVSTLNDISFHTCSEGKRKFGNTSIGFEI